ncbi:MAG TPA: ABC transporter permease, partial [Dongiaceae bacterium]
MSIRRRGWLSLLPALTLALFLLPVLAGVIGTLLPALGFLPGLGEREFSLRPLRALLGDPELPGALIATLDSGLLATLLAFLSAIGLAASLQGTRLLAWLGRLTVPLLAMPH